MPPSADIWGHSHTTGRAHDSLRKSVIQSVRLYDTHLLRQVFHLIRQFGNLDGKPRVRQIRKRMANMKSVVVGKTAPIR